MKFSARFDPIASLDEQCLHSDQCSAKDNQSFCSGKLRCQCRTGFHVIGGHCKPFKRCNSTLTDESGVNYDQGTCQQNEFCQSGVGGSQEGVCQCKPNFKFDSDGWCLAVNYYEQQCMDGSDDLI